MVWQQMDLDEDLVLANFRALDLRIGHVIDICQSLEILGRQQTIYLIIIRKKKRSIYPNLGKKQVW